MPKVPYRNDKAPWQPSLIPGRIGLVSTPDATGDPSVPPKSWAQMASFGPPVLTFAGTEGDPEEESTCAAGSFGIGVVDSALAERAYGSLQWRGAERTERSWIVLLPTSAGDDPIVQQCPAHPECRRHGTQVVESGIAVYGEILEAAMGERITALPSDAGRRALDAIDSLEARAHGGLGIPVRIDSIGG